MATHLLITGHSRGLGEALFRLAGDQGHVTRGLSSKELDLVDGRAVESFLRSGEIDRFFSHASKAVLINNAGLLAPIGMAGTLDAQQIINAVSVNVAAVLALTNAFLIATEGCTDRRIVHISSGAARSPYAGWSVYCASKAALDQHARCLALEGHRGLRIESLAPGVIDTDMQGQVRAATPKQFPMREKFERLKREGGLASPDDVAEKLLAHVMSPAFGQQACTDLRQLG